MRTPQPRVQELQSRLQLQVRSQNILTQPSLLLLNSSLHAVFKLLIPVNIGFSRVAHFQYSHSHLKLCTVQLCTRKQNNKRCVCMLRKMIIIGSKTGVIKKVLTCAAFSHTFWPPNLIDMSCVCGTILLLKNLFICYQTPVMDIPQCKIFMILYLRTEVVTGE